MPTTRWSGWNESLRRWFGRAARRGRRGLRVEWLEDRNLLSGNTLQTATPLSFNAFHMAQATHFLSDPREADLYQVTLNAGDRLSAGVSAQTAGSGLQSLLRIFDAHGTPLALDDQEGGDPNLTFQAPATGEYFLGVSGAPDDNYDPTVAGSGAAGGTTGLYTLNLRDTPLAPGTVAQPDVAGSSFRLDQPTATWSGSAPTTISGSFTVENRGGTDASGFTVQIVLSNGTRFDGFDPSVTLPAVLASPVPSSLGAGTAFSDRFRVQLPSGAPANFPVSGPVYVGLLITPGPGDRNAADKSGVHRGADWETLTILTPAAAGATDLSAVDPNLNIQVSNTLAGTDVYTLTVTAAQGNGRLTAQVAPAAGSTLVPRLTLSGVTGQVLATSDGGVIAQDLVPGTYILAVSAAAGAGAYRLTTEFVQASPPLDPIPVGTAPLSVAVADLTGAGQADLVVANKNDNTVSVLLGNGDGSFRPDPFSSPGLSPGTFSVGAQPVAVAVAALTSDGKLDIVTANQADNTVSVLPGNGDGSFQPAQSFAVGAVPTSVAVADLTGDGTPDLVVANFGDNTVSLLLGDDNGGFRPGPFSSPGLSPGAFAVGAHPLVAAVADLTGDGKLDVVTTNYGDRTVSVLLGNGDGSFQPQQGFAAGPSPDGLAVADLTGNGTPDLVVANSVLGGTTVTVLLGNGDGSFRPDPFSAPGLPAGAFTVGAEPGAVAVADLTGDGKLDLVVSNYGDSTVSVLPGNGDGSFGPQRVFQVEDPEQVAVADLNGDGRPDLVIANGGANTVSVLPGNGDGTFQSRQGFAVGTRPAAVAVADLNGDGKPDNVVANYVSGTVSVLLGNGDGTFGPQQTFAVGPKPAAVAVADLNGDGRFDIVTANAGNDTVSVLLGNGDGSFGPQRTYTVGANPNSVVLADLTGDGIFDIVTTNYGDNTVSVLLGNGDGSFQDSPDYLKEHTFDVGGLGQAGGALAVADLNGDGKPDIVTANYNDGTVSILLGNGDGTFGQQQTVAVGSSPDTVVAADLTGNGKVDLVTANEGDNTVSVLLNTTSRGATTPTFTQRTFAVGSSPFGVAVADFNSDGKPDLVVANKGDSTVSVLPGNGDGTFGQQQTFAVGSQPVAVAAADLNGDGKPDMLVVNEGDSTVSVLLGNGDGTFLPTSPVNGVASRNTPQLADLLGHHDGTLDSVTLDRSGDVLLREGLGGNQFQAPQTINATVVNPQTDRPEELTARDLTVLRTPTGWAVATADAIPDPDFLAQDQFVYTVSLYTYGPDGAFQHKTAFTTSLLPSRIAPADLTGDGLDDLVVANSLDNSVEVAFQQPDGSFRDPVTLPVGVAPSDLALVDVNGDDLPDVVVSDQASGDVSVLLNNGDGTFAAPERFQAGTGLSGLDTTSGVPQVSSLAQSVGLAAGDFTGDGREDLVVVNRGTDSFSVLANAGNGGFLAPQPALTTSTSDQPGPVVAADFNTADGLDAQRAGTDDIAILMEDRGEVWIYTNRGDGAFTHTASYAVGDHPTGLTVVAGSAPGLVDLLVGDQFGDIVRLEGKGDGTFAPPVLTGSPLDVTSFEGVETPTVLVGDQLHNLVTVQTPQALGSTSFTVQPLDVELARPNATLAPGAVDWLPLDGPNHPADAVVIASGSNQVLVYHTLSVDPATGLPTFAPLTPSDVYSVGDDPVSVTMADVNGDGIPDLLVANQGSDDVSVLFGRHNGNGDWVATPGPRLKTGGSGPVAVNVVSDPGSPGGNDLVVTNAQSGTLTRLPGVGQGFFNDQNPQTVVNFGTAVAAPPVFLADPNHGVVIAADGSLLGFDLAGGTHSILFTPPPGQGASAVGVDAATGDLVVAERGGTVAVLQVNADDTAAQEVATLATLGDTGVPSDPSALEVLNSAVGLEVLVTTAGSDAVFVFGPSLAAPLAAQDVSLPGLVPGGALPEATSPGGAPLAVVVTLAAGLLPAETAPANTTPGDTFPISTPTTDQGTATVSGTAVEEVTTIQGASDNNDNGDKRDKGNPDDPGRPAPGTEQQQFLDDLLKKLDLYRPTEAPPWLDMLARQLLPGLPRLDAGTLVAVWQAGADWLRAADAPAAPVPERPVGGAATGPGRPQTPGTVAAAEEEQPAREVQVPAGGVDWRRTLLVATLVAGGAALGVERQLLRGRQNTGRAEPARHPRLDRRG
jgi:hypothetical protein